MGIHFTWEPDKDTPKKTFSTGVSSDKEALMRAFGSPPWHLDESSVSMLEGMAAHAGDAYENNLYRQILSTIKKVGPIIVDGVY